MRKIRVIISFILTTLLLVSCGSNKQVDLDFDILQTKEIVLGNEVDSVDFTTINGEKITFTNTLSFYEIFNEVEFKGYEEGKKYSCNAEMKLSDQTISYINLNLYYFTDGSFLEFRTQKEGSDDVALVEEYSRSKKLDNNQFEMVGFHRYIYEDEKAFGGSESGPNGNAMYKSNEYPLMPEVGTELNEMQARSSQLSKVIISTQFFKNYEPIETGSNTIDFNQFVNREYKLYENYIVFKQTAPFLDVPNSFGKDMELLYHRWSNSNDSITQEAYCNVKTGEIELIKVYGETVGTTVYIGQYIEINMQMYIHNFGETEINQKVDTIIKYIKSNAN